MEGAVFLSASVPDAARAPEHAKTARSVAITAAVQAVVHVTLGRRRLIFGGHPAITPMVRAIASDLGVDHGPWVRLYQSLFFEDDFPAETREFPDIVHVPAIKGDRAASLHVMRERMFTDEAIGAAVFIGGMAGIVDEFEMVRRLNPNAVLLPVSSTGGASLVVADLMDETFVDLARDLDYVGLFHRRLEIPFGLERRAHPEPLSQPPPDLGR